MASFTERMMGAAKLDVHTYEEVEADRGATGQAMAVVVLSSIAPGIGLLGRVGILDLIILVLFALLGWFIWAFLTYFIGTKILPEPQTRADLGELLRTTGFSSSPGLLRVLGVLPVLGPLIWLVVPFWMLIAMVIAVRQALDYRSTLRAVGVCLIGFLPYAFILGGLMRFLGIGPGAA